MNRLLSQTIAPECVSSVSSDVVGDDQCLLNLLEEYLERNEGGREFDRQSWLHSTCQKFPDLEEQIRDGVMQIDTLSLLAGSKDKPLPIVPGFEIRGILGQGGTAIVYDAIEKSLGRRVALKVYPGLFDPRDKAFARFTIEAQAASRLSHPNIVPIHSIGPATQGELNGIVGYMSMKLIDGETLEQHLQRGVPSIELSVQWMVEVVGAIAEAHACGVIHRDLKPSNLLIDTDGQIWVSDFGLARLTNAWTDTTLDAVTRTGDRVGTHAYMSPQQAAGEPLDVRTDIYSLGLTLFEMVSGERAVVGETIQQVYQNRENTDAFRVRKHAPNVPRDLENVIAKATAREVAERYQSANDFADDLKRYLDRRPVLAGRVGIGRQIAKWLVRHQRLTIWLVIGLLVLTGVSWVTLGRITLANHQTRVALETSEENLRHSEEILDRFGLLAAEKLRDVKGAESVRRELLQQTLDYYQDFSERVQHDHTFEQQHAVTHFKAAQIIEEIGADNEAMDAYQAAQNLFEGLSSPTKETRKTWAVCLNNLGLLNAKGGKVTEAYELYSRSIDLLRQLSEQPGIDEGFATDVMLEQARTHGNYAMALVENGENDRAETVIENALATLEGSLQVLGTHYGASGIHGKELRQTHSLLWANLGRLVSKDSKPRATKCMNRAIELLEPIVGNDSGECSVSMAKLFARELANRAALQSQDRLAARTDLQRSVDVLKSAISRGTDDQEVVQQLASAENDLGRLLVFLDEPLDAIEYLRHAERRLVLLIKSGINSGSHQMALAGVLHNLGRAHETLGDFDRSADHFKRSIDIQKQLERGHTDLPPELRRTSDELLRHTAQALNRVNKEK